MLIVIAIVAALAVMAVWALAGTPGIATPHATVAWSGDDGIRGGGTIGVGEAVTHKGADVGAAELDTGVVAAEPVRREGMVGAAELDTGVVAAEPIRDEGKGTQAVAVDGAVREEDTVARRYWSGGAVGRLGPRSDALRGMVSKDTGRDLVQEAIEGARAAQPAAWRWERDEYHEVQDTLRPMQVRGGTGEHQRYTFHDAFAGIGAGTIGMEAAGGHCVGAFEKCARARAVYQRHSGRAPLGGLKRVGASSWPAADVFLSGSPCQDFSVRGAQLGRNGQRGRLMYEQLRLVREAAVPYKVLVFETVPQFRRMHNGEEYDAFQAEVEALGYVMHDAVLFAPDYGSCSARHRLIMVAVRADLHARVGDFHYPDRNSEHPPLHTILEPGFKRQRALVWRKDVSWLKEPECKHLTKLGHLGKGRSGERIYSVDGFATTQTANGTGPGWSTGLYLIDGRVSRLTVRESARLQQLEDDVQVDPNEEVARRQIGNAMPVGMIRAVGLEVGRYLAAAGEEGAGEGVQRQAPREVAAQGDVEVTWRVDGTALAGARHTVRMVAMQAADAAATALGRVTCYLGGGGDEGVGIVRVDGILQRLAPWDHGLLRNCVRRMHWRCWLRHQRRAGESAVGRLAQTGAAHDVVERSARSVTAIMASEEARGMESVDGERGAGGAAVVELA